MCNEHQLLLIRSTGTQGRSRKPQFVHQRRRITSTRLRARRCRIGSSRTGMKPAMHLRTQLGDAMTKMIRR